MKTRFILQTISLFLAILLIATLTLAAMGKLPVMVFWIVAIVSLVILYSLTNKSK